jgi:thiol-disulfide isomerase/thioredoxin
MKNIYLTLTAFVAIFSSKAQTVATDFTQDDCNGNTVHLFEYLEQNSVVILEFFMDNCNPCIDAGDDLLPHFNELQMDYPGHVDWYHFGFNNSYTCETVLNWVNDNGYPSRPFTNGAGMVAYYGGFGMPTIVVVAGENHDIIYSEVGYSSGDDALVHQAIDDFFAQSPLAVTEFTANEFLLNARFNPSLEMIQVNFSKQMQNVEFTIYSSNGEVSLQSGKYNTSNGSVSIPSNQLSNGVYIVSAKSGNQTSSKHITIVR